MTGTRIHNIWKGMINRCRNENDQSYKNYGGRGIFVSDDWKTFENFYRDMIGSYSGDLTIERNDNDGPYSKENCCWVPKSVQAKNRRAGRLWNFKGSGIASNTSGIRGVSWDRSRQKWIVMICVGRVQRNLGRFDSKEMAAKAYATAASELRA